MLRRESESTLLGDPFAHRKAGDIPDTFTYRQEDTASTTMTDRSWGLYPLGYQPVTFTSWLTPSHSAWQPAGTEQGHPYILLCWQGNEPPHIPRHVQPHWPVRIIVIVPTHINERLQYHDQDLHRRAQANRPINLHPNWVDIATGLPVDRTERNGHTVPGVAVYTAMVDTDAELRQALAGQDFILWTDPQRYIVQAALTDPQYLL